MKRYEKRKSEEKKRREKEKAACMKKFIPKQNERSELVHSRMSAGKARFNTPRLAAERKPYEQLLVQGLPWGMIPFILILLVLFIMSCAGTTKLSDNNSLSSEENPIPGIPTPYGAIVGINDEDLHFSLKLETVNPSGDIDGSHYFLWLDDILITISFTKNMNNGTLMEFLKWDVNYKSDYFNISNNVFLDNEYNGENGVIIFLFERPDLGEDLVDMGLSFLIKNKVVTFQAPAVKRDNFKDLRVTLIDLFESIEYSDNLITKKMLENRYAADPD